jgi:hypothetical protein
MASPERKWHLVLWLGLLPAGLAAQSASPWRAESSKSPLTDAPIEVASVEVASVEATYPVVTPQLVVRCSDHQLDVFMATGMPANPENLEQARQKQVSELEAKLAQLSLLYTSSHPAILAVQQDLAALSHGFHQVRIQFDQDQAFTQRWSEGADHKSLYAPRDAVKGLLEKLAGAEVVRVWFIPFNGSRVVAEFHVVQFSAERPRLAQACGEKR